MKKYILVLGLVAACVLPVLGQDLPQWAALVKKAEQEAHPLGRPESWFGVRKAREESYEAFCYEQIMTPEGIVFPEAKRKWGKDAQRQLQTLHALLIGRRQWLQVEANRNELFAPYAVVADYPLDFPDMSEESFLKLRALLRGDFSEFSLVNPRVEQQGNTVMVWFENWTKEDKSIRLAFETSEYILDICRNHCEENPFQTMM